MLLAVALLLASPTFDGFDEPLSAQRWWIGVGQPPRNGRVRIPKNGWLVSRHLAELTRLEVVFRGELRVTFHAPKEPLSSPLGDPIVIKRGKGERTLTVTADGATLDGAPLAWKGPPTPVFRLAGRADIGEVRVEPRGAPAKEPSKFAPVWSDIPQYYTDGKHKYTRVTMTLWDTELRFLLARGKAAFARLRAPVKGSPTLAPLIVAGDARDWRVKAASHALANADWRDERSHLTRGQFLEYLDTEFAIYAVLQHAQRALNLAVPDRDLEPLVHLAMIRHTANAHSAVGLAQVQGAKKAVRALQQALGKNVDLRRAGPDQIRRAAGEAARALLGGQVPAQWSGFAFDPASRFATIENAREFVR